MLLRVSEQPGTPFAGGRWCVVRRFSDVNNAGNPRARPPVSVLVALTTLASGCVCDVMALGRPSNPGEQTGLENKLPSRRAVAKGTQLAAFFIAD